MDKQLFFGYGANRNRSKITQIIGKDPGEGVGAILESYSLHLQKLDQIPDPAQSDLKDIFGNGFSAYTIRPGKGFVAGIVWSVTEEELKKIKEWEYVGNWRDILEVTVKSEDFYTVKVLTEKVMDIYPVSERVDGIIYSELEFTELKKGKQKDEYYTKVQLEKIRKLISQQKK
ncbi:MAG TPA: hypothetical protein VNA13_00070 [Xanthomonadales bacterium]|nr:hypothetical protein [Xanthomonadales bacterium]